MATQAENDAAQAELERELREATGEPEPQQVDESETEEVEDESQQSESDDASDDDEADDEIVEDDADESDDDDESDEDEDEESERSFKPNSSYKNRRARERAEKQKYLDTIAAQQKEIDELRATQTKEVDPEIQQLAQEKGIEDPETLQRIIEIARNREPDQSNAELRETVEQMQQQLQLANEENHFVNEWNDFEPSFRTEFPNATDEQVAEAAAVMDQLSHSKKWHTYDLDYIFYKNRDAFASVADTPKKKGLEVGRSQGIQEQKEKSWTLPDNPSDDDLKDMEKRMAEIMSAPSTRVL